MSTEQRLVQLENRCRRLSRCLIAIGCVGVLAASLGAKAAVAPQKLQVTELEVLDAKGNVRIWLGDMKARDEDLFGAKFLDSKGGVGVTVWNSGQLQLLHDDGGVVLAAHGKGANLQLSGEGGRPRAMLYARDDHAGFQLRDTNGNVGFIQETDRISVAGPRIADPFAPEGR